MGRKNTVEKYLSIISLGMDIDGSAHDFFMEEFGKAIYNCEIGEIHIIINSSGGNVYDGMAIFEAIRLSPKPVTTIIQGRAFSVAAIIAQAGHTRKITKHSTILLHPPTVFPPQKVDFTWEELDSLVQPTKRIEKLVLSILAEKTGKTIKQLKEDIGPHKKIFDAKEALAYGLVDEII